MLTESTETAPTGCETSPHLHSLGRIHMLCILYSFRAHVFTLTNQWAKFYFHPMQGWGKQASRRQVWTRSVRSAGLFSGMPVSAACKTSLGSSAVSRFTIAAGRAAATQAILSLSCDLQLRGRRRKLTWRAAGLEMGREMCEEKGQAPEA